jgi:hypothetical protein
MKKHDRTETPRKGVFPLSADVEAHIKKVRNAHPDLVKVRNVIDSVEGRPIWAMTVTDPSVSDADKQNVLVVGGQHGNEESGRIVALGLIDWLVTPSAAQTRRKQKIVVMPSINPDSAETDMHANAIGVQPNLDHDAAKGPTTPEGQSVEIVAKKLQPEVYVDLHACGGMGCSTDLVLYPRFRPHTMDDYFLHVISDEMVDAGEQAGIPQTTFCLSWWGVEPFDSPSSTAWCYRLFKSIVLLTENTESNTYAYSVGDRSRAGVAKLKALLAWGNRRYPKLMHEGYPNSIVSGTFDRGLVAIGKTAAARRASRVGIWANLEHFTHFRSVFPEPPTEKTYRLAYDGPALAHGVGLQTNVRGKLKVARATLDGKAIKPSPTNGYTSWSHGAATYFVLAMPTLAKGEHELKVWYK